MDFLWLVLVFVVTFFVNIFGFCQVVGSLRTIKIRGVGMTAFTLIIWIPLLLLLCLAVHTWFADYKTAHYISAGISFLLSLNTGKNGVE